MWPALVGFIVGASLHQHGGSVPKPDKSVSLPATTKQEANAKGGRNGWGRTRPLTLDEQRQQMNRNADAFNEEIERMLSRTDEVIAKLNMLLVKLKADGVGESDSRMVNLRANLSCLQQSRDITARLHLNKVGK